MKKPKKSTSISMSKSRTYFRFYTESRIIEHKFFYSIYKLRIFITIYREYSCKDKGSYFFKSRNCLSIFYFVFWSFYIRWFPKSISYFCFSDRFKSRYDIANRTCFYLFTCLVFWSKVSHLSDFYSFSCIDKIESISLFYFSRKYFYIRNNSSIGVILTIKNESFEFCFWIYCKSF